MSKHPILFSAPMVRALLDGSKTQTRRVIKPQPFHDGFYGGPIMPVKKGYLFADFLEVDSDNVDACTPYENGDNLWVRETWTTGQHFDGAKPRDISPQQSIGYLASDDGPWLGKIRPSIFMPKFASRLTLSVTDVRVQRVQDIEGEDAISEGVILPKTMSALDCSADGQPLDAYRHCFMKLWDSINAKRGFGWDTNPWVAAYTFTVHKSNIDRLESHND